MPKLLNYCVNFLIRLTTITAVTAQTNNNETQRMFFTRPGLKRLTKSMQCESHGCLRRHDQNYNLFKFLKFKSIPIVLKVTHHDWRKRKESTRENIHAHRRTEHSIRSLKCIRSQSNNIFIFIHWTAFVSLLSIKLKTKLYDEWISPGLFASKSHTCHINSLRCLRT